LAYYALIYKVWREKETDRQTEKGRKRKIEKERKEGRDRERRKTERKSERTRKQLTLHTTYSSKMFQVVLIVILVITSGANVIKYFLPVIYGFS